MQICIKIYSPCNNVTRMHSSMMRTDCSSSHVYRGVCVWACTGWGRGVCPGECIPACTEADTPTVDRILDTHLWKYYLAATSLRTVVIPNLFPLEVVQKCKPYHLFVLRENSYESPITRFINQYHWLNNLFKIWVEFRISNLEYSLSFCYSLPTIGYTCFRLYIVLLL